MKTKMMDTLYMAWAIATKDVLDVMKNKNTRTNVIIVMGMVVFFFWASTPRPFDKRIDVVVYDEGNSGLVDVETELGDGSRVEFIETETLDLMIRNMGYKELGLVIPAGFVAGPHSADEVVFTGYIQWQHRTKTAELEARYSQVFSEMLEQPVRIEIGDNFVKPSPSGESSTVHFHILFATLLMALQFLPQLMLEEKKSRTMEALMVSPVSAGQVVMGKALVGVFYILIAGVVFFALNWVYVANWGLALIAFAACTVFSVGLALMMGTFIPSSKHLALYMVPIMLLLIVPSFFANEPLLSPALKALFAWLPTTALVNVFQLSLARSAPLGQLLTDLAIASVWTALIFAAVVWKLRRSDR
jgi:ABC-2 type transport system permease protein